jgi:hypothetical protein
MAERPDPMGEAERLASETRKLGVIFLLTELQTANAVLDVIDASTDPDSRERRLALAVEAYDVVTDRLARTGDRAAVLTPAERGDITRLRDELRDRLERQRGRG